MKLFPTRCWLVLALCAGLLVSGYSAAAHELECAHGIIAADRSSRAADSRQYAPDREIQMLHLALEVTPDFAHRTVSGKATLHFKPIAKPLRQLRLHAVDLEVESISSTEEVQAYNPTPDQLVITFAEAIPAGTITRVVIAYRAFPTQGLYFRTPAMGYKAGETHLFTQGEPDEARHWYPSYDYPNQRFTTEILCWVPSNMTVLSNGTLVSREEHPDTGLLGFRWLQNKPHVNYLVTLVAGHFSTIEDQYRDIPMAFHTPPSDIEYAANSFADTRDMMAFFEEEIGVLYPWDKYDQVVVRDFMFGGMENTSLTTLTDRTLFSEATENLRSSQGLVAHELAHQWFGNLVTCKDWSQIWLNESFATYYEHLYENHKNGPDSMRYNLRRTAKRLLDNRQDTRPIVYRKFQEPIEVFRSLGHLVYGKGAWVLHMLRGELGPDLYRECIRAYLERNAYGAVVTQDLVAVIEELSGRSYDRFFDQWIFHGGYPELNVNYSWDELTKLAKVSVTQIQITGGDVLLFHLPISLRFKTASGTFDREIRLQEISQDYYFPLPEAPATVRIDPDYTLLAKINFTPPKPMIHAQLDDPEDMMGRLLAVEWLGERKEPEAVGKLKAILQHDPFYGVRIQASQSLRAIHSPEAFAALLDSREQPDARVRRQVVSDLGGFYREEAFETALQVLERETNPDILSPALESLAAYGKPEVRRMLIQALNSPSFRNTLADAALRAMRAQDDPAYIPVLLGVLLRDPSEFTTAGFAAGLDALAHLGRNLENKQALREFLSEQTQNLKNPVQLAAIRALATLQDPAAIPLLEKFTAVAKNNPVRQSAEKAVADLRAGRKPADELRQVRTELLHLNSENRELRQAIDDLKKQFEAFQPAEK